MELTRLEGMGRLAAGVAHDLNNILMVMAHGLDVLDRERLRDADREALGDVLGALERGRSMVHDLLHFGRDRHDRPAVVAVEGIVDALVRMFTTAGSPGFRVVAEHRSAVSRVMLDRSEIERALMNLIVNARDAMGGQGDVHVVIGEEQVSSGPSTTRHVTIAVRDTGHGMDEETRRRMFEPFFTRKADGTGLGLAIAHQVVTRAGGSFRVSSTPGEGTTITILLPPIE
jgi:two-component system, cell cycle sensor histidine kinase and response regulator CckA